MARGEFFTEDELVSAIALNARGVTLTNIALRRGRSRCNLSRAVNAYKRGEWAPSRLAEKAVARRAELERAVSTGLTHPVEIARSLGMPRSSVRVTLMRMGLDNEMRRETANGDIHD